MMNFEIVKKQIIKSCKDLGITEIEKIRIFVDFFKWYYEKYYEYFGEEHKRLTTQSITTTIENMLGFDEIMYDAEPTELLKALAEQYFTCEFTHGTDYSIAHFSCTEVLQNRIYEILL